MRVTILDMKRDKAEDLLRQKCFNIEILLQLTNNYKVVFLENHFANNNKI